MLDVPSAAGLVSLIVMLVIQTGALFYWGGKITQTVRDHERRLSWLEKRELMRGRSEV